MKIRLFVITALLLSACSQPGTNGSASADLDELFAQYSGQSVTWTTCDESLFDPDYADANFSYDGIECAEISVPYDYQNPEAGEDLSLTIMRDPASGANESYQGVLFMNPGGPGSSGIDFVQSVGLPPEIRASFDVIGVDPRGVGASSPVRCDDELDLRSYFEQPLDVQNQAEADESEAESKYFYEDCEEKNPHWWTIRTENVVNDFELLRQILAPDQPFNFIGHSYGTTIAGRYITQFPEHVGRIVLDSPVKPDDGDIETDLEQIRSMAEARTAIFEMCAEDELCAGDTVQEVENNLISLRDRVLEGNMQGYVYDTMGGDSYFQQGNGESAYLILRALTLFTYLPVEDGYYYFLEVYQSALEENYIGGFEYFGLYLDGYDPDTLERDNSYEVLTIVNCLDIDERDLRSETEIDAEEAAYKEADPFATRFSDMYDFNPAPTQEPGCFWSWQANSDDAIPDPPATQEPFKNDSGTPVVTIGSKGDNVTPFIWSQATAESLKSDLISYEGTGHSVLWGITSCIDDPVTQYLLTGVNPGNLSCPAA